MKVDFEVPAQFAQGNLDIISTTSSYDGVECWVMGFSCVFTQFFGLPRLFEARWPTVVGRRGLGVRCIINPSSLVFINIEIP